MKRRTWQVLSTILHNGYFPAFINVGLYQAVLNGFCTPGLLWSGAALLATNPAPTLEEVKTALAGNLCRCTGYTKIYDAVLKAADRLRNNGADDG